MNLNDALFASVATISEKERELGLLEVETANL